jgi:hypothetical protein
MAVVRGVYWAPPGSAGNARRARAPLKLHTGRKSGRLPAGRSGYERCCCVCFPGDRGKDRCGKCPKIELQRIALNASLSWHRPFLHSLLLFLALTARLEKTQYYAEYNP